VGLATRLAALATNIGTGFGDFSTRKLVRFSSVAAF
jgi:hypothetical protein